MCFGLSQPTQCKFTGQPNRNEHKILCVHTNGPALKCHRASRVHFVVAEVSSAAEGGDELDARRLDAPANTETRRNVNAHCCRQTPSDDANQSDNVLMEIMGNQRFTQEKCGRSCIGLLALLRRYVGGRQADDGGDVRQCRNRSGRAFVL